MKSKTKPLSHRVFISFLAAGVALLPFLPVDRAIAAEAANSPNERELTKIVNEINAGKTNKADIFTLLERKVDLLSFLGKPVRIPIASDNPDKLPGQDVDYLYIIPPQFYQDLKTKKILSSPVSAVYYGAGKSLSPERVAFIQDGVETVLNNSLADKKLLTEEIKKNLIAAVNRTGWSKVSFWDALKNIFRTAEAKISGGTPKYSKELMQKIFASSDPRVDKSVNLLALNLVYSDIIAWAANLDKEACLLAQGSWSLEGKCDLSAKEAAKKDQATCRESGGTWGRAFSYREICRNQCGTTNDQCSEELRVAPENAYGCLCPPEQCLGSDGKCVASEASQRDGDGDGISNARDKCPHSKTGEFVGLEGCSCEDYQKTGVAKIEARECPKTQCEGIFYVSYPESGTDQCVNGFITLHSCSPTSRQITPECQDKVAAEAAADYTPSDETSATGAGDKNQAMRKLTRETNGGKTFVAAASWARKLIEKGIRVDFPTFSIPRGSWSSVTFGGNPSVTPSATSGSIPPSGWSSSGMSSAFPSAPAGGGAAGTSGLSIPPSGWSSSGMSSAFPSAPAGAGAAGIGGLFTTVASYVGGIGIIGATAYGLEQLRPTKVMGPLGTGSQEPYDPNAFGPSGDPGFLPQSIKTHNEWVWDNAGKTRKPGAMAPEKQPGGQEQPQGTGKGQSSQGMTGTGKVEASPAQTGTFDAYGADGSFLGSFGSYEKAMAALKKSLKQEEEETGTKPKGVQDQYKPTETEEGGGGQKQ